MPTKKALVNDDEGFVYVTRIALFACVVLFEEFLVFVVELINTAGRVNEFHLTSIERVRSA